MPLDGQASGNWTESASSLRILYTGVKNTVGVLTDDAFTQSNPPVVTTSGTVSDKVDTSKTGVLGGSVAFTRPDGGSNFIGGPQEGLGATQQEFVRPLGMFVLDANGYAFQNIPGQASGKGTYTSGFGTYGTALYETQALGNATGISQGDDLSYSAGNTLIASRNGYLMPGLVLNTAGSDITTLDIAANAAEVANGNSASTVIGVLKMVPDSTQSELVFDQRI